MCEDSGHRCYRMTDRLQVGLITYQEYGPDSVGTRRDECLVEDSHRQVLVDGNKDIEVVQV